MKKLILSLMLVLGLVALVGCSDDDFDFYENEGDEKIEVQEDDNEQVIYVDEDDKDWDDQLPVLFFMVTALEPSRCYWTKSEFHINYKGRRTS
ncbi:MAG: hypothetical protein ACE3JP_03965 [Ectobacillus sp.]